jgi:hypothetical protein
VDITNTVVTRDPFNANIFIFNSLKTRIEMVLETLVSPAFNHLTRLAARESFIAISRREIFKSYYNILICSPNFTMFDLPQLLYLWSNKFYLFLFSLSVLLFRSSVILYLTLTNVSSWSAQHRLSLSRISNNVLQLAKRPPINSVWSRLLFIWAITSFCSEHWNIRSHI